MKKSEDELRGSKYKSAFGKAVEGEKAITDKKKYDADIKKARENLSKAFNEYSSKARSVDAIAEEVRKAIINRGGKASMVDFVNLDIAKGKEFFLSRVFEDIDPDVLTPYQQTDIRVLLRAYGGKSSRARHLFEFQDRVGEEAAWKSAIRNSHIRTDIVYSEAEKRRLNKIADKEIDAFERILNGISGNRRPENDISDHAFASVSNIAASAQLGTATLATLSELATPIMTFGFYRTMAGHVRMLKEVMSGATSQELKEMTAVSEEFIRQVQRERMGLDADYGDSNSMAVRMTNMLPEALFKYTGMNHLTTFTRMSAAKMSSSYIAEIGAKVRSKGSSSLSQQEVAFLSQRNLTIDDVELVSRLIQAHTGSSAYKGDYGDWVLLSTKLRGTKRGPDGAYTYMITKEDGSQVDTGLPMDDVIELRKKVNDAAVYSANNDVLSAGPGVMPKVLSDSKLGKFIGLYLPFLYSATMKVSVPLIQNPFEARKMATIASMISISMLATYMKSKAYGRDEEYNNDPSALLRDAISNSGVLGMYGLGAEIASEAAGDRYDSPDRAVLKSAGAGVGYGMSVLRAANDPNWENIMRTLPFQNFLGLNAMFGK